MKTRMTFRVADDLADALRALPNQTHFVETVLRDALGMTCPLCEGEGRLSVAPLQLPNFKRARLPTLDRETALRLKAVVRLGRQLAATNVDLRTSGETGGLHFSLRRNTSVLLNGSVDASAASLSIQ